MIVYLSVLILVLIILLFFTSKKLSPIPYFPSNKKDLKLIIKALGLKNNQTVVDLGAGDGIVIFAAATESMKRRLDTKFVATEINPFLILILHLKRLLHPNRKQIKVLYADMFKFDLKRILKQVGNDNITIFLYISPWFMEKVYKKLRRDLGVFRLVSYYYAIPRKKAINTLSGSHKIFLYLAK